jgi:transcriptional regulator of arginine metabolism
MENTSGYASNGCLFAFKTRDCQFIQEIFRKANFLCTFDPSKIFEQINHPMDKDTRKQEIKKIIGSHKISGQEELLDALKKMGYEITQATLSRDIKELGIAKMPDPEKGYIYVLPQQIGLVDRMGSPISIPGDSIQSVEFSYDFGIIRTLPGFASSIAIYIDTGKYPEIAGTIAGDDTILIIPREPATYKDLKSIVLKLFPGIYLIGK